MSPYLNEYVPLCLVSWDLQEPAIAEKPAAMVVVAIKKTTLSQDVPYTSRLTPPASTANSFSYKVNRIFKVNFVQFIKFEEQMNKRFSINFVKIPFSSNSVHIISGSRYIPVIVLTVLGFKIIIPNLWQAIPQIVMS